MRRLLLFRHSHAGRAEPGGSDFDRGLSERGRADAACIGTYLARHDLAPDHALVSPAVRAQQSWTIAAAQLRTKPANRTERSIYNAEPAALLGSVAQTPSAAQLLMLVGHNPGLHELALLLIAAGDIDMRERLREELPTSGLAVIDFALTDWSAIGPDSGRLERFVTPDTLESAAL